MNSLYPQSTDFAGAAILPFVKAKRSKPSRTPNRLREFREMKNLSLKTICERTGIGISSLARYETGEYQLTFEIAEKCARAMGISLGELLPGADARTVHLVGKVGAGTAVLPFDDYPPGTGMDEVPCPSNLDPRRTVAVSVDGDSMAPLESGSLLFYTRDPEMPPSELINRLCVVKLATDGGMLVKQLRRGSERGRYTLWSSNAPPIENVELEWATRVLDIRPPELFTPAGAVKHTA